MANYTIYVLDETDLTISDGGILDGVDQGDGSHLDGLTLTLDSRNFQPVDVVDDDTNFQDNDSSQTLDGDQTVNGVLYSSGTIVEAEYGFQATDGVNTWTFIGFNVRDSAPTYATVEGLAVLDAPQGPPPINTPLTITGPFEGPNFMVPEYSGPICFATGTLIDTPEGPRPVEALDPGMSVLTRDHGVQQILWRGGRRMLGRGKSAPVRILAGALGATETVVVSQQHKVLLTGWRAELLFGASTTLIAAKHLVGLPGVGLVNCGPIGYHHILLEDHAVLRTHGLWSETLQIGAQTIDTLLPHVRRKLEAGFPELIGAPSGYRTLKKHEAHALHHAA